MQRWSYKIAYRSERAEGWIVDGNHTDEFDNLDDPEVLNRLGDEGWELVSVVGYTYFFKQPKPAQ